MSNMYQPVKERQLAETVTSALENAYMKSNVYFAIASVHCIVLVGNLLSLQGDCRGLSGAAGYSAAV